MIDLSTVDVALVLSKLRPASAYASLDPNHDGQCDWDTIVWRDESTAKPTEAEILAAWATIDPVADERASVKKGAAAALTERSAIGVLIRALMRRAGITRAELLEEIKSGRADD